MWRGGLRKVSQHFGKGVHLRFFRDTRVSGKRGKGYTLPIIFLRTPPNPYVQIKTLVHISGRLCSISDSPSRPKLSASATQNAAFPTQGEVSWFSQGLLEWMYVWFISQTMIEIQNWAKRNAWQQCVHLSVDLVLWGLLSDWWVGEPHGWWGVGPGKCSQVLPVGPSTSTQRYISVKNCMLVIYPTYPWGPFKLVIWAI